MRFAIVFAALSLVFPTPAAASAQAQAPLPVQEMYAACTGMVSAQPQETLARARKWYEESQQPAALHCLALAQFELKDYAGAADSLERLLAALGDKRGAETWLSMKKQIITAHRHAQNGEAAERHLSEALRYVNDQGKDDELVPLLLDRARLFAGRNENLRAIQDLDHALSIKPAIQIVLERARVYLNMGEFKTAEADIRRVLKNDPLNEDASKLLGELERRQNEGKMAASAPIAGKPQEDEETARQEKQARELEALERKFREQQKKR